MCTVCGVGTDASAMTLLRDRFDGRPFRVAEAMEAGVSRDTLSWLRKSGRLTAAGRRQLQAETRDWEQTAAIIARFFTIKAKDLA